MNNNSLKYNIEFFKFSLDRLKRMNIVNDDVLNKVIKRISLLDHICKCSDEITNYIYNLDFKHMAQNLSDTDFLDIVTTNLDSHDIKISVNIMTFNEERCIARCIESIKFLADEIIVLDSGSTDKTRDIIMKSFPEVTLRTIQWKDDFSFGRNTLVDHSSGDWIIQIDADEFLLENQVDLKEFLQVFYDFPISPLVISPKIINHDNTELEYTKRILKKKDQLQFFGLIHEELRYDIKKKGQDLFHITTDFVIHHDGYTSEIIETKQKLNRNIKLQEKMIQIEPDNIRWYYFLAREKKFGGYGDKEVIDIISNGMNYHNYDNNQEQYHLYSLLLLAQIYNENNNFDKLDIVTSKLISLYPYCLDGWYYKLVNEMSGNLSQRYYFVEDCLNHIKSIDFPYSTINAKGDHVYRILGMTYLQIGNYQKAFRLFSAIEDKHINNELNHHLNILKENIEIFLIKNKKG
ncbi:hypothetical protein BHL21_07805 [Bacillus cereus]|uniref:glycosyltransferase family 2 protein n=1 Tax=Bacillus cereus TaxID=1396 RepID=UPI00099553DD|nr:glycosyltransferase family 2 protein [Bacillus cereus]OPA19106.1 hypothetical protein BHL21_07805 [Bacillus cereus]